MIKYQYNDAIHQFEIDPQFIEEGLEYAEKEGHSSIQIRTLNLNSSQKYDLDFSIFSNQWFIEGLAINDCFKVGKIYNIDGLYTLKNLKFLSFHDPKIKIDFSKLSQLEELYFKDYKNFQNLGDLVNLKHLLVISFKQENLEMLSGLKSLELLRIAGEHFVSTKGIESLNQLKSIKITYTSKVQDISNINKLPNLEELYIERCKRLTDFSFLKANKTLKKVFIDRLDSIDFVPYMKNLKSFKFWDCKDGNMNPLLKTKGVEIYFYPNKRHYTHTIQDIIASLKSRK